MRLALSSLIALCMLQCAAANIFGQGFVLPGLGPINRSMGGAATAAPLDATGALNWNPATISGLSQSRADIGIDVIYNRNTVHTGLFIGTPGEISGSTDSDVGVWALPAIGIVYKPLQSPWTYGLGLTAIGGFSTNYPASTSNPLFMPPPVGFGHMYSRLGILQIAPTASYQITDRLSFGFAPTINMADAQAVPFPFDAPNPPGIYPDGTGSRYVWGLGAQAGVYYKTGSGLNLGASLKSPQWFERVEINSTDAAGFPREVTTQFNFPMIMSLGASYDGIEDVLIAADVRYVDFDSAELFGEPAEFQPVTERPRLPGAVDVLCRRPVAVDRPPVGAGRLLVQSESDPGSLVDGERPGAFAVSARHQHWRLVAVDGRAGGVADICARV
jgi:long-chain fatty acid transport protein